MARRKKKRFRKIRFLLEVIVLVILAVGLFVAAKITKLNMGSIAEEKVIKNESIPSDELNKMTGYTNIALFGLDSRTGQLEAGANSDTIMICSINNTTKEIKLVSVYRDTYLDDGTGSFRKCTEVYAWGGAEQAISMLNKNLDLNITDYVTVNFEALVEAVDLFGGVDINLTEGEVQWLNSYLVEGREVLGRECEDVAGPGLQTLNGMQALAYCRIRYIGMDYERTERQREVLSQLAVKARKTDLLTVNKAIDQILPMVSTSLSYFDLVKIASGVGSFSLGETLGFPFEKTTAQISAGDCVIPINLTANVSQLHSFLYGTEGYQPSATVQQISDYISTQTGIY